MREQLTHNSPEEYRRQILQKYIPGDSVEEILGVFLEFNIRLIITAPRQTKLGDYRPPSQGKSHLEHVITVNRDLNKYSFLITLIHEVAHMLTWIRYQNRVKSHGSVWKETYSSYLSLFLNRDIFPIEIEHALNDHLSNPQASSCRDITLTRVLRNYDEQKDTIPLENLSIDSFFKTTNGLYFRKGHKARKNYRCMELASKKTYIFNPLIEVYPTALSFGF